LNSVKRFVLAIAMASALAFVGVSAQASHHENPCGAENPCDKGASKGANPCDKGANPCDKGANPCDKGANPCDKGANPCDHKEH
jgi:uncharacterized membrane protein